MDKHLTDVEIADANIEYLLRELARWRSRRYVALQRVSKPARKPRALSSRELAALSAPPSQSGVRQ